MKLRNDRKFIHFFSIILEKFDDFCTYSMYGSISGSVSQKSNAKKKNLNSNFTRSTAHL